MVTESLINQDLATGSNIKTNVSFTIQGNDYIITRQETDNTNVIVTPYGKSNDMYSYWDVYSKENEDIIFIVKPDTQGDCNKNDIRAFLSNVKINSEVIDSWTKFGTNNIYDVDDYGPINKILNWKDRVFFIQDTAFGAYAINRTATTTTEDGQPTELGSNLGFGKHQYFSKEIGSIHQWAVKATTNGIHFFDAIHRKIQLFTGAISPFSEIKGMHSYVNGLANDVFIRKENGGDNPILNKGVTIGKSLIDDEVIYTFLSRESKDSLVIDELAQAFTGTDSATPPIYVENGDIIMTPAPLSRNKVYTHGLGNWGEFYGIVEECSLTLVINPNADINKILRTFEFNSIVRDDNKVIDRTATITAFRVKTEYQDTGKVLFSSGRIKRRFDKWRVKIPRDTITPAKNARLRSTHFILSLYFDNAANKELIMNGIISYYDIQQF